MGNGKTDTDGDGYYYDYRDLDSDDDGKFDIDQSFSSTLDADNDGQIDTRDDADGDGIADPADDDDTVFGGLAPDPFITTWKTDNPGTSAANQIIIPMNASSSYNYTIDWGDGCSDTVTGSDITQLTHTFDGTCTTTVDGTGTVTPISGTSTSSGAGTYTVEISGVFPHFRSPSGGDEEKILSVDQWGDIAWRSMGSAFSGATICKCWPPMRPTFPVQLR